MKLQFRDTEPMGQWSYRGVDAKTLRGADRSWRTSRARAIVASVFGIQLAEVASWVGRHVEKVSSLMSRLSERMGSNRGLKGSR